MFNLRTFSENQRDPIARESQLEYDRNQNSRPRLSPTERAMARARRRNQPVAHAGRHQGVSPRGRTSVEEARARAQARVAARSSAAAARVQPRSPGTYAMLPPTPAPRPSTAVVARWLVSTECGVENLTVSFTARPKLSSWNYQAGKSGRSGTPPRS